MDEEYRILYVEKPEESAWGIIGKGIDDFNNQQAGDYRSHRICFAVEDPGGDIVGGVVGIVYWDWLSIELLWIKDEFRGCGYGSRLLASIENEGRKHGAKNAYLDTFSFQAPGFYTKHGYHVYGQLPEFPAGHQRYFLTKPL